MTIATGFIIFLLSLVALVAEFLLYIFFGMGASFSGADFSSLRGTAYFFVSLMVMTAALGVISPISAIIGHLAKKKVISYWILLPALTIIFVILALAGTSHSQDVAQGATPATQTSPEKTLKASSTEQTMKDYLKKIEIKNVEVGTTILDEPGVFGEIKNQGDKTLEEIEITVYFLDSKGAPIYEMTYYPVLVSETSFGNDNKPLKPGYGKKFGYKASDVPSDWAKKVRIEVTNVKFTDSK